MAESFAMINRFKRIMMKVTSMKESSFIFFVIIQKRLDLEGERLEDNIE
jgi:hypothetical protein